MKIETYEELEEMFLGLNVFTNPEKKQEAYEILKQKAIVIGYDERVATCH